MIPGRRHTWMRGTLLALSVLFAWSCQRGKSGPPESSIVDLRGEARRCVVHGRDLGEDLLEVFFGYIDYDHPTEGLEGYEQARRERFPHSWLAVADGPEVAGNSYARVSFCQECREAEVEWYSERGAVPLTAEDGAEGDR